MSSNSNVIRESWNEWADTWYPKYRTKEAIEKVTSNPASAFHRTTFEMIQEAMPDLKGKRVLVPSSGDNHAVFAFHFMGARVTSCDISEKQIEYASAIAKSNGWDIEFVLDDTMQLSNIKSNEYDFVYTSNGVHVWIHDLNAMYRNIQRVMKPNGTYIMFDIHPFMRPFGIVSGVQMKVNQPYDSTGPFGDVPTYKWRMQDLLNAMMASNLSVKRVEEMYAEDGTFWVDDSTDEAEALSEQALANFCNWQLNPLAALPQWLSVTASK